LLVLSRLKRKTQAGREELLETTAAAALPEPDRDSAVPLSALPPPCC
jgi:hypothetical protein